VESNEDALSDLSDEVVSKLSRSVVSLVLSDGDYVLLYISYFQTF
jgi:hypothetical protein